MCCLTSTMLYRSKRRMLTVISLKQKTNQIDPKTQNHTLDHCTMQQCNRMGGGGGEDFISIDIR